MKIIVSRQELLAALLFASKDESRYTLNAVQIEVSPNKKPIMVATDGRRLAVIKTAAEQEEEFTEKHSMLPSSAFVRPICALSKALGGKNFPWISIENKPGSLRVFLEFIGANFHMEAEQGALVEGEFCKWRAVLPDKKLPRTGLKDLGINADFVGDFAKAAKVLEAETPVIQMNLAGGEAIEVIIPSVDTFYALIMPCRINEVKDYQPEFVSIVDSLPPPPEPEKEKEADVESDKQDETAVTIETGGKTVTMTAKQLSKAAARVSKAFRNS